MSDGQKLYSYWLSNIEGIGCKKIWKLLNSIGEPEKIYNAGEAELADVDGISEGDVERIETSKDKRETEQNYKRLCDRGISFLSYFDAEYPKKLKDIVDPPFSIYYRGDIPDIQKPSVAVVGARNSTYEGNVTATRIGRELAECGVQVISGLARGIDINSQKGALSIAGGKTFAVMGCGIDICYPSQNINEYTMIQREGGIISEYPPGVRAKPYMFPMRNRIISGLADVVLVIEAGEKSGSLITAEYAMEQGKDVFVVPGSIYNKLYYGSNKLIKNGAGVVTCTRDILDGLGIFVDDTISERKKKNQVMLENIEKMVYASLSLEPSHISDIAVKTGLSVQKVMDKLVALQMKHLVRMVGSNYYVLEI